MEILNMVFIVVGLLIAVSIAKFVLKLTGTILKLVLLAIIALGVVLFITNL